MQRELPENLAKPERLAGGTVETCALQANVARNGHNITFDAASPVLLCPVGLAASTGSGGGSQRARDCRLDEKSRCRRSVFAASSRPEIVFETRLRTVFPVFAGAKPASRDRRNTSLDRLRPTPVL